MFYRYVLAAPIEWADDVARGLMVALSFFGAAGALARNENIGVAFFVESSGREARERVDALAALVVLVTAGVGRLVRDRARAVHDRARRPAPACRWS